MAFENPFSSKKQKNKEVESIAGQAAEAAKLENEKRFAEIQREAVIQAEIARIELIAKAEKSKQEAVQDYDGRPKFESLKEEPVVEAKVAEEDTVAAETIKAPETFDRVRFERIINKRGEIVAYRSSAFGRKEIRLDPSSYEALTGTDSFEEYRVRVISDTNPEDPERGSYIAEIIGDLEHKEAQKARAERLRESRGFKTVAAMLNSDPDLSLEYRTVVDRHKEYRALHQSDEERHRNFTGMLSALMMSERGKNLLDRVMDRTITAESDEIKERILTGEIPPYVPGVTIGAGVYGAVLAATRQMYLPEVPDLTVDQSDRVGGQFAQYRSDLFRLNSRRRPELPDAPHLPGTAQSLNSFGKHSVMQSSDTGAESYPHQSTIADTARTNFFLSGKAMLTSRLQRIRENNDSSIQGKMILEFVDTETQKVLEVATDRITFSTGLGEERDQLDPSDAETRRIVEEEKERLAQGEDARVMSFTEFAKRMSDPANPFPLKDMKRLILSGRGDSANVIAGIALGYESQLGKTASQLDNIEEIIWVGQQNSSKEEFLRNVRVRYAEIGLEFPRERYEQYYHRIKPLDARSFKLRRTEDGIRVILQNDNFDSKVEALDRDEETRLRYVEGDHFIYAHGFEDTTDSVIASAYTVEFSDYADEPIKDSLESIRNSPQPNTSIYYKKGYRRRLDILEIDTFERNGETDERITIGVLTDGNEYLKQTLSSAEFRSSAFFNTREVDRIEEVEDGRFLRSYGFSDTEFAQIRGRNRPVAQSYRLNNGGEVYKVGPAANLPLTFEERRESPALRDIPENTASIFRQIDPVEAFAERTAKNERADGVRPSSLLEGLSQRKGAVLPSLDKGTTQLDTFTESVSTSDIETIGLTEQSGDLLKLAIGDALSPYTFPDDLKKLNVTFVRTAKGRGGTVTFKLSIEPSVPQEYEQVFKTLVNDSLCAGVLNRLTENIRSKGVSIEIPIQKGKAAGAGVLYRSYTPE